jgi:hypothetical protein
VRERGRGRGDEYPGDEQRERLDTAEVTDVRGSCRYARRVEPQGQSAQRRVAVRT